jgi:hypothetical protein
MKSPASTNGAARPSLSPASADRERHRDEQQARDAAPLGERDRAVELEPGREQRHDERRLGQGLDQVRVRDRVDPVGVEHADRDRAGGAEAEVDERRGERPLVLVRQRADRREDGDPDEQDAEVEGVEEVEACPRAEGDQTPRSGSGTSGPSGPGGSGSSGSGASGPSGVSGAIGPGTGSAGTAGVSGTTGPTGSDGVGISSVRGMRSGYPRVWRREPWIP